MGIVGEYIDQTGEKVCHTTDETRRALLAAMGVDASTDDRAREALMDLRATERRRRLDPVRVVRTDDPTSRVLRVRATPGSRWRLEIHPESGEAVELTGRWGGDEHPAAELRLPHQLPLGYHRVRLFVDESVDEQTLIVVPPRCITPVDLLGEPARTFGVTANLYTIQSGTNWGVGDFTDLGELAAWAGDNGADFIGVNPLHALLNRGHDISPYGPLTRLFRNPIYIDIANVPELGYTAELCERIGSPEFLSSLDPLRESNVVRYEQVMAVKGIALDALHRVFADETRGKARDRAYARYCAEQGTPLDTFALWMTIMEQQSTSDWRRWPAALRSAHGRAVEEFARAHAARIDFDK